MKHELTFENGLILFVSIFVILRIIIPLITAIINYKMLYLDDMEYHFSKMVLKKIEELENNPEYNPENIDKSELPELKKQLKQHIKEIKAQYKIF